MTPIHTLTTGNPYASALLLPIKQQAVCLYLEERYRCSVIQKKQSDWPVGFMPLFVSWFCLIARLLCSEGSSGVFSETLFSFVFSDIHAPSWHLVSEHFTHGPVHDYQNSTWVVLGF